MSFLRFNAPNPSDPSDPQPFSPADGLPRVAFYHGSSAASWLIRCFNWGPYSHAAWVTGEGKIYEAWIRGVQCSFEGAEHKPGTKVDLYRITGITSVQSACAERFLIEQIGKPYDWVGVMHFVTRRSERLSGLGRWFCSKLVFAAAMVAKILLLNRVPAWKVSPTLLSYSPLLEYDQTVMTA